MKIEFFTIDAPSENETTVEGALTSYKVNKFLNENGILPVGISAEFNELSGKVLLSLAYKESKPLLRTLANLFKKDEYEVRFESLCEYKENAHTKYIQLQLENAINFNTHLTISHGIFVEHGIAKVVFLEHK